MIIKFLLPDKRFNDVYEITPEYLKSEGITALICDIDNTLEPYEEPLPTPRLLDWLKLMQANGIKFAFVSNNHADRVKLFNRDLGFFASADSSKPFSRELRNALAHLEVEKQNAAMLGDQVFTDVLAGKAFGIRAILVNPIRDKRTLFFRIKRWLEKPILRIYDKNENK